MLWSCENDGYTDDELVSILKCNTLSTLALLPSLSDSIEYVVNVINRVSV